MQRPLTKSILAVIFGILILTSMVPLIPKKAYGDGFAMENLPPASVGNLKLSLFVKLDPPIITSDLSKDRTLTFRLFDADTNQTIPHDTLLITVTKHDQLLLRDKFHTHDGVLTLVINPTKTIGKWTVYGNQDDVLGWTPDVGQPIRLLAPILGEGGLYHINVQVISFQNDKNSFAVDQIPNFDSYLSVGDITNQTISYQNNPYDVQLISYYDKVDSINFDESSKQFSWSMPFDWNVTRFANRPIFIHEELHVPKAFKDFSNTPTYSASAQGFALTGRRIIVDPYTQGDNMIVHLFLNKPDIDNIAKTVPTGINTITFNLAPEKPNVQTSSSLLTDFGGWHIQLGWNPSSLTANSQNNLKLTFLDAFTEQKVAGDVNYDIQLQDTTGSTLWSKTGAIAKAGTDTQSINLPGNGIYSIVVKMNSVITNGLPDTTRTGLGRGNVVIPSTPSTDESLVQQTTNQTSTSGSSQGNSQSIVIPAWIKNNAGWWHDGTIDDNTFVQGIQYMITNGIMKVPHGTQSSSSSNQIPAWIKNNAGWWHDGTIDDNTFVQGIQYMITNGIIVLKQ